MNYVTPPNKHLYYEQVWSLVRQIPVGKVATYGQIAKLIPKPEQVSEDEYQLSASRWVGLALSACPDNVPWQRVVNSQGKISSPQLAVEQRNRLLAEGVLFSSDKLDLREYQWVLPGQPTEPSQGRLF